MYNFFINLLLHANKIKSLKMVILHDAEYYRSRKPEPDLGALRNFMRFVWNPKKKQLFGRSGKEWGNCYKTYFFQLLVIGYEIISLLHSLCK